MTISVHPGILQFVENTNYFIGIKYVLLLGTITFFIYIFDTW